MPNKSRTGLTDILKKIEAMSKEIREIRRDRPPPDESLRQNRMKLPLVQKSILQAMKDDVEMTAADVAAIVNRTRPLMVVNLNQLVALGLLKRERRGKCIYFRKRSEFSDAMYKELVNEMRRYVVIITSETETDDVAIEHTIVSCLKNVAGLRVENVSIMPHPR